MKDWDVTVPYSLPRISSLKKSRNNTMPVKQQKPCIQECNPWDFSYRWHSWRQPGSCPPAMIPDPDYSESESQEESDEDERDEREDEEDEPGDSWSPERLRDLEEEDEEDSAKRYFPRSRRNKNTTFFDDSRNRSDCDVGRNFGMHMKSDSTSDEGLIKPKKPYSDSMERRMLHKELTFKQKYGQSSMKHRTELQRAIEKYTESKVKKDLAATRKTSLEKILEKQARKIDKQERDRTLDIVPAWIQRLQQQHVTNWTDPKKDEFYRVHAKVVGNQNRIHSADEDSVHSSESASSRFAESSQSDYDI